LKIQNLAPQSSFNLADCYPFLGCSQLYAAFNVRHKWNRLNFEDKKKNVPQPSLKGICKNNLTARGEATAVI